jgi:hypothetical protein
MEQPKPTPLELAFQESLSAVLRELGLKDPKTEAYLAHLLVEFLHRDRIFGIRDLSGRQLESVAEMLAEGDVRLNATSFDRERQVHKHLGDFLLFWSGMFPAEAARSGFGIVDPVRQGKESYWIAASFDHPPFDAEAPVLSELSGNFEGYRIGLQRMRSNLGF